jgi:crotonobetainyl-CoA:carnitine CoA-transferase CaiB-like acyl-CoA transferase
LDGSDVPSGPVNLVSEALGAMQAVHGGDWLQQVSNMSLAPNPILLDGEHLPVRMPPPRRGEHTDEILREIGLSDAEVAQLRAAGVVA